MILSWKYKLMALGAGLLTVLAFFVRLKVVTAQRDKAKQDVETLKVAVHVEKVRKKESLERTEKLYSHRVEIMKEVEKNDKDFKGLDNLSDSNDWDSL